MASATLKAQGTPHEAPTSARLRATSSISGVKSETSTLAGGQRRHSSNDTSPVPPATSRTRSWGVQAAVSATRLSQAL